MNEMVTRIEPCLSVINLRELIPKLPNNVFVQRVTIEACRLFRHDNSRPESQFFDVKQTYPNLYVPHQTLVFSTPLMNNGGRFDQSNEWENFVTELEATDKLCSKFQFEDSSRSLTDIPISDRLFIKDIILLELPKEDPNYHEAPYLPQQSDDEFYDGVRCSFATFTGAYQLIGYGTEEERDGWLPGMTRKPMDLEHIEVVRTKHILKLKGKKVLKAFHRGKGDIHTETKDLLVNNPQRVGGWIPSLVENGLITWREVVGEWKESSKFIASRISLKTMLEEEGELEADNEG
jgi:hypothetical protein